MEEPQIKTGFTDLDKIIGGLYPGELMVIGAGPAIGKTSFLAALIRNITWKYGTKGLLFSLTTRTESFRQYLVSSVSGIPSIRIRQLEKLTEEELAVYNMYSFEVGNLPIFIDDTEYKNINELIRLARKMVIGGYAEIIYIDNFEYISVDGNFLWEAEVMSKLKQLAKELNIPIVGTRQSIRAIDSNTSKFGYLPISVKKAADVILLLARKKEIKYDFPAIADLYIAKNLYGDTGDIKIRFFLQTLCFENLEPPGSPKVQQVFLGGAEDNGLCLPFVDNL